VTVGDHDHRRVAMPPAALPGGVHKALDLGGRKVLTGPQRGIRQARGRDCSVFDAWGYELQVRYRHVFGPSSLSDCWDNGRSSNSWRTKTRFDW
jgi:hypothetical protein